MKIITVTTSIEVPDSSTMIEVYEEFHRCVEDAYIFKDLSVFTFIDDKGEELLDE